MIPYYSEDGIDIYLGDCREVLPTLEGDVDAVVTDPPYGDTSLDWDQPVKGWLDLVDVPKGPFSKVCGSCKSRLGREQVAPEFEPAEAQP